MTRYIDDETGEYWYTCIKCGTYYPSVLEIDPLCEDCNREFEEFEEQMRKHDLRSI